MMAAARAAPSMGPVPAPQLVKEDQRLAVRLPRMPTMFTMWEENVDKLWAMDSLVAHVGQHPAEHLYPAVVGDGDMQAALGHEGEQADGLDGHRLAAGIGAGDYQGVEVLPQHQVVGHRPVRVQQGVAGLPQVQAALHDSGGRRPASGRPAWPGRRSRPEG